MIKRIIKRSNYVLVTGASGFLGESVVKELDSRMLPRLGIARKGGSSRVVQADIFNLPKNFFENFGVPSVLIHLAWEDGFVHNSQRHLDNLPHHFEFIRRLSELGCKNVNILGSMHEVGKKEGKIDETTPCEPISLYGIAKNSLRQSVFTIKDDKLKIKWLRAFYISEADKRGNSVFSKLKLADEEGQERFGLTNGTNRFDFISLEDLTKQIVTASLQTEVVGIINVCSGTPRSFREVIEDFHKKNHLRIKLEFGRYPEREGETKELYGDNSKIKKIMEECK